MSSFDINYRTAIRTATIFQQFVGKDPFPWYSIYDQTDLCGCPYWKGSGDESLFVFVASRSQKGTTLGLAHYPCFIVYEVKDGLRVTRKPYLPKDPGLVLGLTGSEWDGQAIFDEVGYYPADVRMVLLKSDGYAAARQFRNETYRYLDQTHFEEETVIVAYDDKKKPVRALYKFLHEGHYPKISHTHLMVWHEGFWLPTMTVRLETKESFAVPITLTYRWRHSAGLSIKESNYEEVERDAGDSTLLFR
jgi:hypothetical protein